MNFYIYTTSAKPVNDQSGLRGVGSLRYNDTIQVK